MKTPINTLLRDTGKITEKRGWDENSEPVAWNCLLLHVYINNNGEVRNFKIQSEREVGCELQENGISYFFPKQGLAERFEGTDPLVACITALPRE